MGDFCSSRVLCESIMGQTKKHDVCKPICVHQNCLSTTYAKGVENSRRRRRGEKVNDCKGGRWCGHDRARKNLGRP